MITIFTNIHQTTTPFYLDILDAIERIRTGNSKTTVEDVRNEQDKTKQNEIKKQLPAICFSGKFAKRGSSELIEHSGYICLDFDGFKSDKEMKKKRKELENDEYTFSVFTSPSGNGLKLIVKIPADPENHKKYFLALENYYKCPEFDKSTKDIGRVCYESYDPDVYVNEFSSTWTKISDVIYEQKSIINDGIPTIKLSDKFEIANRLLKWWEREFGLVEGARNHNLYVLCQTMNEFGIEKDFCKLTVQRFEQPDFPLSEILTTVDSAYSKTELHGTKYYEDSQKIDDIKKDLKVGKSVDDIVKSVNGDSSIIRKVAEHYKELSKEDEFWTISSKGAVSSVHHLFKKFLQDNGFWKYYHVGSDKFVFVRIQSNLIDDATEDDIKQFVLNHLFELENKSIYNYFAEKTKMFKEDFLSLLDRIDARFVTDTESESYIYFRNCALKVTADSVEPIDYIDLGKFVWKKQIINRDFIKTDSTEAMFRKFVRRISRDEDVMKSIESTIGFLLHGFKPADYCPAVIINDEKISDNPEGGTGKGILVDAIGKIKREVVIDGKAFSFDKSFPYQTVSADTQVLVYDDVLKNFDFERLFSVITQGITLEKKNKDAIKVPFEHSPKIVITTNYAIKGSGNSNERRKWEIELAQYFNKSHTPRDEFGCQLFSGWDSEEWNMFDNYMLSCLQFYLAKGFYESGFKNIKARKLIAETSFDFYEWASSEENYRMNTAGARYQSSLLYSDFTAQYPDYQFRGSMSQKRFYTWLHKWGLFRFGMEPERGRSSEGIWITFMTEKVKQQKLKF